MSLASCTPTEEVFEIEEENCLYIDFVVAGL
jgi:hypothetical protein